MADSIANKRKLFLEDSCNDCPNDNHMQRSSCSGKERTLFSTHPSTYVASSPGTVTIMMQPSLTSFMRPSFPFKLYEMLDEATKVPSLKAIVSWQPHGRAFIVHNTYLFIHEANKRSFFKQTKYASFQRQLNLYGFGRISTGVDKGAYHHKLFLRGEPGLCHRIQRIRIKGTKVRKPALPATEPDFYSMPPLPPSSQDGVNEQGGPYRVACQTKRPPKSTVLARSSPVVHNVEVHSDSKACHGVSLVDSGLTVQSPDMGPIDYVRESFETDPRLSAETLLLPPLHGQDQVNSVAKLTSCRTKQMMEKSADMEQTHNILRPCLTTQEMTRFPKPSHVTTRSVSDSPDPARVRQVDNTLVSWKAGATSLVEPMWNDLAFVLNLELPTHSGQPTNISQGITFVQGVDSQPKVGVEVDGKVPFVLGQSDGYDHSVISPFASLVSNEDSESLARQQTSWSITTEQEDEANLGLERLPADTELEEFIAFYMRRMDHI